MFFLTKRYNYQAFIEKKDLLSIDSLIIEVVDYEVIDNNLKGNLLIKGNIFIDDFDKKVNLLENLSFNLENIDNVCDINIENLNHQVVEGRGIELEFDFLLDDSTERNVSLLEENELKEAIVETVNEKLEDKLFIKEVEEETVEVEEKEDVKEVIDLPKTSRIVYRFSKDENGKRCVTRG